MLHVGRLVGAEDRSTDDGEAERVPIFKEFLMAAREECMLFDLAELQVNLLQTEEAPWTVACGETAKGKGFPATSGSDAEGAVKAEEEVEDQGIDGKLHFPGEGEWKHCCPRGTCDWVSKIQIGLLFTIESQKNIHVEQLREHLCYLVAWSGGAFQLHGHWHRFSGSIVGE